MSDIQLSGLQSRTDIRTSTGTSEFFHKKKFMEHLATTHKINIESKKLSLTSVEQFLGKKRRNSTITFIFLNLKNQL